MSVDVRDTLEWYGRGYTDAEARKPYANAPAPGYPPSVPDEALPWQWQAYMDGMRGANADFVSSFMREWRGEAERMSALW